MELKLPPEPPLQPDAKSVTDTLAEELDSLLDMANEIHNVVRETNSRVMGNPYRSSEDEVNIPDASSSVFSRLIAQCHSINKVLTEIRENANDLAAM